ncbi:Zn(II)2Cys6 transcription factor [Aspergillus affinis]|uniref:Zn(II)2Cys6 transcription factor n=1 Tax=Aspergillus affinis TaxID=1070780 RepID=UPI0022FF131C|nr:uncharacterized protein KD926_008978 [Aspergillus affinis]KAI9039877.1 hypothetical protein KD926_008978 [Aspergillus affinis]
MQPRIVWRSFPDRHTRLSQLQILASPAPPSPSSNYSPAVTMSKRLPLSCENCRQRKIRCFGSGVPCNTCLKRGVASTCQFKRNVEQNQQRERLEATQDLLLRRISELEDLLLKNIELVSTSNARPNEALRSPASQNDLPRALDDRTDRAVPNLTDTSRLTRISAGSQHPHIGTVVESPSGHVRYIPHGTGRDQDVFHSLQGQSQSDSVSSVSLFGETFPSRQSLLDTLPPFRHCDELLATFNEVFSPLFHILHDGKFESNYANFKQDPQKAPLPFIGLIFVALGLAVTAINKESAVLFDLGREASPAESARSLAAKYRQAAMRCLAADNFMWQHSLQTLQCLVLLIYAINHAQGPAWALLGTTLNIAIAMGCHVDPALLNLDPVEVQERRRAWAGLMMLYTIQNTCLGNLVPFTVENNVQLPADIEDTDIMPESLHEIMYRTEPLSRRSRPTKMSYILFKFRLYSLASSICILSSEEYAPCWRKIQALDYQIQTELQAQSKRFTAQVDLPLYHQAHSFILNNYTNHLILMLHRICLMKPHEFEHASLKTSYEKCEEAALAMLSNHERLSLRYEFQPYSWYIHGLGSFHAFLAISTLLVLLRKEVDLSTPRHLILQAMQSCARRFHEYAPQSEICKRAASILDQSILGELAQRTPSDTFSNDVVSSLDSMPIATSDSPDNLDPTFWSLPESFEEIVSKIPCEKWLSPAVFPWTDRNNIL